MSRRGACTAADRPSISGPARAPTRADSDTDRGGIDSQFAAGSSRENRAGAWSCRPPGRHGAAALTVDIGVRLMLRRGRFRY